MCCRCRIEITSLTDAHVIQLNLTTAGLMYQWARKEKEEEEEMHNDNHMLGLHLVVRMWVAGKTVLHTSHI